MSARPALLDAVVASVAPDPVGSLTSLTGLRLELRGLDAAIGDGVEVLSRRGPIPAEVVALGETSVTALALGPVEALAAGAPARRRASGTRVPVGDGLLGRVIDSLGRPIDGKGPLIGVRRAGLDTPTPGVLQRQRIDTPLGLGVRALDTMTAFGRGQRMGLFAGSGVGKSSLLSMIARGTDADVSVIALVGERGREVREFVEDDLGAEGLRRSVVVVATADDPALLRVRAAFAATRIAEEFRERGGHVTLMMDSLTRVAMAQREIGLSAGEPPATRGYPPSTFGLLARLLERAGTAESGSISGIYTVLVEGDDHNEPIADTARSILDGHVVLDRTIASTGHFPAIDVLASISRVASRVTTRHQAALALELRRLLAARASVKDLLDVGAYVRGANPLADRALDWSTEIDGFLAQGMDEQTTTDDAWSRLSALIAGSGDPR